MTMPTINVPRKFGLLPEAEGFRPRRLLSSLLRLDDIIPPSSLMVCDPDLVNVHEQGWTGTCAAHTVAQTIRAYLLGRGVLDPPEPSVRWLYRCREIHRDGDRDEGTSFSVLHRYLNDLGWCSDKYMAWSDEQALKGGTPELDRERDEWINQRAPVGARHHAFDQRGTVTEYAVPPTIPAIKAALATGHPIQAGGVVTSDFMSYYCPDGLRTVELTGTPEGGHGIPILGYDDHGGIGPNSWGKVWGYRGWFRLGWESLCSLPSLYAIRYAKGATS